MDHLNRRDFVKKAGLGAAGTGILAGCGDTETQDANGDGVVNSADLNALGQNWLNGT